MDYTIDNAAQAIRTRLQLLNSQIIVHDTLSLECCSSKNCTIYSTSSRLGGLV